MSKEKYCYLIQQIKVKTGDYLGTHPEVFTQLEGAEKYIKELCEENNFTYRTDNYLDKGYSNIDNFVMTDGGMINIQIIRKKLV